jgi:hypothetical protein
MAFWQKWMPIPPELRSKPLSDQGPATLQDFYDDGLAWVLGVNLSGKEEGAELPVSDVVSPPGKGETDDLLRGYDPLAATGLLLAAGREEFAPLLKAFGGQIGLLDPSMRMLPLRRRVEKALELTLAWMNDHWQLHAALERGNQELKVFIQPQPSDGERESSARKAAFVGGVLQALLTWISGGKFYPLKLNSMNEGTEILLSRNPLD